MGIVCDVDIYGSRIRVSTAFVRSFCSVSMIRISRIYWEYLCRDCRTVVMNDWIWDIGYRMYMQKERELLLHSGVAFFDANPSIASIRCSLHHRAYLETMAFTKCAVLKHNEGTRWSRQMGKGNISVISWHRQAGNCRSNSNSIGYSISIIIISIKQQQQQ